MLNFYKEVTDISMKEAKEAGVFDDISVDFKSFMDDEFREQIEVDYVNLLNNLNVRTFAHTDVDSSKNAQFFYLNLDMAIKRTVANVASSLNQSYCIESSDIFECIKSITNTGIAIHLYEDRDALYVLAGQYVPKKNEISYVCSGDLALIINSKALMYTGIRPESPIGKVLSYNDDGVRARLSEFAKLIEDFKGIYRNVYKNELEYFPYCMDLDAYHQVLSKEFSDDEKKIQHVGSSFIDEDGMHVTEYGIYNGYPGNVNFILRDYEHVLQYCNHVLPVKIGPKYRFCEFTRFYKLFGKDFGELPRN